MSSSLWLKDEMILKLSNVKFERFYENLLAIGKQKNIQDNSPSMKLITSMNYGAVSKDIIDYFTTKKDIQEFIKLVTLAIQKAYNEGYYSVTHNMIEKTQEEYPGASKEEVIEYLTEVYGKFYQIMLDFRQALIGYARTLKLKERENSNSSLN